MITPFRSCPRMIHCYQKVLASFSLTSLSSTFISIRRSGSTTDIPPTTRRTVLVSSILVLESESTLLTFHRRPGVPHRQDRRPRASRSKLHFAVKVEDVAVSIGYPLVRSKWFTSATRTNKVAACTSRVEAVSIQGGKTR